MPRRRPAKRAVPPVSGGGSSIDALPDGVLEHILGFLPAAEAVQTSVLARRWRHLWKSATGLRIAGPLEKDPMSVEELRSLVSHLLVLRRGSPLDTCDFTIGGFSGGDDVRHVNLWFREAVMCRARTLRFCILGDLHRRCDPWLELDNLPLVSEHLTKLELFGVTLHNRLVNFSRCPALDHLEIDSCNLSSVTKISSDSVWYLSISDSDLSSDSRIHIYAPNLVALQLHNLCKRTPMLCSMPSLVDAVVRINIFCTDLCNGANYETCDCESCDNFDNVADGNSNSVLLKGLSEAKNLALLSESKTFIFKRDLRWCPMFRKLKTLLLDDFWCVPDDFRALACLLEHSPILEKLTFQLCPEFTKPKVEMKLCVSSTKRSTAISEYLNKVELKCKVVDDSVLKILKFLSTYNIYFSFE